MSGAKVARVPGRLTEVVGGRQVYRCDTLLTARIGVETLVGVDGGDGLPVGMAAKEPKLNHAGSATTVDVWRRD